MCKITKQQLVELLDGESGNEFIGVDVETIPAMRKSNNPYYIGLTKTVSLSGGVGASYANAINNKLKTEGIETEFSSSKRPWGETSENKKWVFHKDQTYLNMIVLNSSESQYYYNGELIEKDKIEPYLQKSASSKKQTEIGLDESKQVIIRTIKIDNIKKVRIKGTELEVI